jgi:pantoate--beta-alanine ligase
MRSACKEARRAAGEGSTLALVPTLGAIHEGHLSLVAAAREACDVVAASIFVNPLQFGPAEDFARYPRPFEDDCRQLSAAGVDLLFAPSVEEIYRPGASTFVEVAGVSDRLDGASRPGHFRGVATVVAKLFNIIAPEVACFGQKDAAQVAVLQAMVRDLDMPVRLLVCPTVREADGLAMSSRNRYLTPEQRMSALSLSRALGRAEEAIRRGETNSASVRAGIEETLRSTAGVRLDYVAVVRSDTLEPVESIAAGDLIAVAAWVGETRLIDNLKVDCLTIENAQVTNLQVEAAHHG